MYLASWIQITLKFDNLFSVCTPSFSNMLDSRNITIPLLLDISSSANKSLHVPSFYLVFQSVAKRDTVFPEFF